MKTKHDVAHSFYPEINCGGYSAVDGTVQFFSRVNALLHPSMSVLDFGAGRASATEDTVSIFRRTLRSLKGKVQHVVGCDIDEAVFENETIDEAVLIQVGKPLPFEDEQFDIIVSDYTFEHLVNPEEVANELYRVLKPGGWLCARTPNKWSYTALATRIIKNSFHKKVLSFAQPNRKDIDIFPTTFKLNSMRSVSHHFGAERFENYSYFYEAEPAYHFNNSLIFWLMFTLNKFIPSSLKSNLFLFLRKKGYSASLLRREAP